MGSSAIDGVLFDLDNTLLDRQSAFSRVAEDFYEERLRHTVDIARDLAVAKLVAWDADGYAAKEEMLANWLEAWPAACLNTDSVTSWYRTAMQRQVRPDSEVNRFLASLNDRFVPWGIVTNGSRNQRAKCMAAGLERLAPFIIISEEAGYRKPDPAIFCDALARTGLAMPDQIMFVGDNPQADIDGAKRFGMKAAWIRRGRQYPAGLQQPDYIFDHVVEVRKLLEI